MRRDLAVLTATGATLSGAAVAGTVMWNRRTAAEVERLWDTFEGPSKDDEAAVWRPYSERELVALPDPVARYFRFALPDGHAVIRRARLRQSGHMRTGEGKPWAPFTAVHHVSVVPLGFVWDASWHGLPLVPMRIRDRYVEGQGAAQMLIGGIVRAGSVGSPEVASASLTRYLAEAAWLPSALLPRSGVSWSSLGNGRAAATLRDHDTNASIDVQFGDDGRIDFVSAMRYRDVGGRAVLTPWGGRFSSYDRIAGMMIPREATVEWTIAGKPVEVWRGRIESAEYELALVGGG